MLSSLAATPSARPGIRRRYVVLTVGSALGALLFLPFLSAGAQEPVAQFWPFAGIAILISAGAAWPGLLLWDRVQLPMPLLRGIERGEFVRPDRRSLLISVVAGVLAGVIALFALNALDAPAMPGSLVTRIASAVFAAVTLEVVVHLLGMGLIIRATGRIWAGVVGTAIIFVLFHLSGTAGLSPALLLLSVGANGGLALMMGGIGARFGFEYLVLCHLVAHIVTVGGG